MVKREKKQKKKQKNKPENKPYEYYEKPFGYFHRRNNNNIDMPDQLL